MDMTNAREFFSALENGTARLWRYTSSHDRLVVELNSADKKYRKYLVLIGCTEIHLPSWWRVKAPRIDAGDSGFVFSDTNVKVLFAHEFQLVDADPG
ncbi:hypothetical protein ACN469_27825 [Corallococcus terminator]